MATRFDTSTLQKARRTSAGFLKAPVLATRTGVFSYRLADGTIRRELRHPDDVFDPASLATLAGVPVTDGHPKALLDANTVQEHMTGWTGDEVTRDGIFVKTGITVTVGKAIANIEGGKYEVSLGYKCDEVMESGVWEGMAYDLRQTNIEYNHLAVVERGRAGAECRIKFDAADAVQVDNLKEGENVEKILINGVWVEVSSAAKLAIETHMIHKSESDAALAKVRQDSATAVAAAKSDVEKATARADGLDSTVTRLQNEAKTRADAVDPTALAKALKARRRIDKVAQRVLAEADLVKMDAMDDQAVMVAVIKAEHKDADLEGKSAVYIEARFDTLADSLDKSNQRKRFDAKDPVSGDLSEAEKATEAARIKAREDAQAAWQPKQAKA